MKPTLLQRILMFLDWLINDLGCMHKPWHHQIEGDHVRCTRCGNIVPEDMHP